MLYIEQLSLLNANTCFPLHLLIVFPHSSLAPNESGPVASIEMIWIGKQSFYHPPYISQFRLPIYQLKGGDALHVLSNILIQSVPARHSNLQA